MAAQWAVTGAATHRPGKDRGSRPRSLPGANPAAERRHPATVCADRTRQVCASCVAPSAGRGVVGRLCAVPLASDDDLEDGRLDELADRHGFTIAEVRRMMGPQRLGRRADSVPEVEEDPVDRPAQSPPTTIDGPSDPEESRLVDLATALGITIGDVRWLVELADPRRTYKDRLDIDEIRRRYEAGKSLAQLGAAMGVSYKGLRSAMVTAGIPRGSKSPRR
jgi:hypothetical protein